MIKTNKLCNSQTHRAKKKKMVITIPKTRKKGEEKEHKIVTKFKIA